MWGSGRLRRSAVARARLATLSSGWVPTPQLVEQALGRFQDDPGQSDAPLAAIAPPAERSPGDTPVVRVGLGHSAARGVLLLAAGAALGAVVVLLLGWPRGETAPDLVTPPVVPLASGSAAPFAAVPSASTGASSGASPSVVVVDVAGFVRRPGVVELTAGSRVVDAIKAAGGLTSRGDTTGLNLAQVLNDGEQVLVLSAKQAQVPVGGASAPASSPGGLVDINTATLTELDTLPGIGPVLAQAIVDWRTQNGSFTSIEQLREVSGIGDATFADLQALVRV